MFKLTKRSAAATHTEAGESVMHAANSSKGAIDVQRELIRVAFKDTRRNTGVPSTWVDCEVHYHAGPAGTERVQVHLVMKHWSGHLLRYAMAFQSQVMTCLDRYEPTVDHSNIEWMWKFSPECECPFPNMPAPEEWAEKLEASRGNNKAPSAVPTLRKLAITPVQVTAATPKDRQFDLRDVFADLKA